MLSEKEKEAIRVDARALLQRFGAILERVKETPVSSHTTGTLRAEGAGRACDDAFREGMFANAPNATKDCIVAEKAVW